MMISKNHTPDHVLETTLHASPAEKAIWDSKSNANHMHSIESLSNISMYNPTEYNGLPQLYSENYFDPFHRSNFDRVAKHVSKLNKEISGETDYSDMYLMSTTAMGAVSATRSGPVMLLLPNGNMLIVVAASDTVLSVNELILATNTIVSIGTINITGPSGNNLSICAKVMPNGLVLIGYKYSPTEYRLHTYNCMSNALVSTGNSITVSSAASIHMAMLDISKMIIGVTSSTTSCSLWVYNIDTSTVSATPVATINIPGGTPNYIRLFEMVSSRVLISIVANGPANSSFYTYHQLTGLTTLPITIPDPGLPPDIIKLPGVNKYLVVCRHSTGMYRIYIYDASSETISQSTGSPVFYASTSSFLSIKLLPNGKVLIMFQFNSNTYSFLIYNPETDKLEDIRTPSVTVTSAISKPSIVVAPDNTVYAIAVSSGTVYSIYRLNGSFGKMNPIKMPIQHLLSPWM